MLEEVKTKEEIVDESKPLLNIELPAPISGDPNAPMSVGRHNAAARHNFQEVANVLLAVINNQKLVSLAIVDQDKKLKQLQEDFAKLSKLISESLSVKTEKENKNEKPDQKPTDTINK